MKKQSTLGSQVDLKQFFKASVMALQNDGRPPAGKGQAVQRNSALVQRTLTERTPNDGALAHAARALTALWKVKNPRFKEHHLSTSPAK